MMGLDIKVKCPDCGEIVEFNLGITDTWSLNGRIITYRNCPCCRNNIFFTPCETIDSLDSGRINISMSDDLYNSALSQVKFCVSKSFDLYNTIDCVRELFTMCCGDAWMNKYNRELTTLTELLYLKETGSSYQLGISERNINKSELIRTGGIAF